MKKTADKPTTDRRKVSVTERNLLVADGLSKKLANIRKELQAQLPVAAMQCSGAPVKQLLTGLKPEVAAELNQARKLVDSRINQIMHSFPEGKKNRLFGFRFGTVDDIKNMSIKSAFKTLGMDDNLVNIKLIAKLNYHGNAVKGPGL